MKIEIYSIGHSTRSISDFIELLQSFEIKSLVDIRTIPGSRRNPQYHQHALSKALNKNGISYLHLPELGGLRKGLGEQSPNKAWKNLSFRGYADYMLTEAFEVGLQKLLELSKKSRIAMMCAEAVPWRCHRSLVSDALFTRGIIVKHILSKTRAQPHKLTSFAKVEHQTVTYPLEELFSEK
jgi:uncharacterized protein (DUF488 family)